jgi:protein SERAC1
LNVANSAQALAYSASRTSKHVQHYHSIYVSTYAILFFGTPHGGSSLASIASTTRKIFSTLAPTRVWDSDGAVLDDLTPSSQALLNITDMFAPLMKQFRIVFYWEQEKTDIGPTKQFVVDQQSAAPILDNTERAGLRSNHRDMCRFASRSSPGYRLVAAQLMRFARDAPTEIEHRWVSANERLRMSREQEAAELLA